jgi:hypothetical protein
MIRFPKETGAKALQCLAMPDVAGGRRLWAGGTCSIGPIVEARSISYQALMPVSR